MRDEMREREGAHGRKCRGFPSSKSLGSIYRGGEDGCLYFISLMGEILQICPEIFTTRSFDAVIKSLYL
jgi:hypothetical protein